MLNQCDLLRSQPSLYLLLARNSRIGVSEDLEMNQTHQIVPSDESAHQLPFVLVDPAFNVIRDADVQDSSFPIRHYVDVILFHRTGFKFSDSLLRSE